MPHLIFVVIVNAAMLASIVMRFKFGWLGLVPSSINLAIVAMVAWLCRHFVSSGRVDRFDFRALIIILSLAFGAIASNAGLQLAQMKFIGTTYVAKVVENPADKQEEVVGIDEPTFPEIVAQSLTEASLEEVSMRGLTLGALLMIMPSTWAVVLSALIFAAFHGVAPIFIGHPEIAPFRFAPSFALGIFCGVAFVRYGVVAAILVHILMNLVPVFRYEYTFVSDVVMYGTGIIAVVVLGPTLWLTRKRKAFA